ncbi:BRO family protein [Weissella diestrammenae]|uniref:BRO family protein n=1 Tax=Weissella diestrammenae TaxID=1162633 RepID=UPI001960995C|nr:BRO family protein [Weissella diestrammenae]MCM0582156.1 ORF6C domain-containing protein [Weissella diestrammenae]
MENVTVFNFEQMNVRTVVIDNEPYFVGKDVADVLGYKRTADALKQHVDIEDKGVGEIQTPGGIQNMTVINESGVYSLIFGSKLESAKRFKKWVTTEVLPSIRKTGSYAAPMTLEQKMQLALESGVDTQKRVTKLEDDVTEIKENAVINASDYNSIATAVRNRVHTFSDVHTNIKLGPLFKDLNSQIKRYTGALNRSRIKSKDFDRVINFIDTWSPSTVALIEAQQVELDV